MSSSIGIFKRFMKPKASQSAPQLPDRTNSSASPASFSTPEIPVKTVNIPSEAFPYETQVSWPPSNSKLNQHVPAIQPQLPPVVAAVNSNASVPAAVKPEPPSQPPHPEILIPARKSSTSVAPNLIHIPIDSSPAFPAFDDEIFRWNSDPNSIGKSASKSPKFLPTNGPNGAVSSLPTNMKSSERPFMIPVGEHVKNGHQSPSPLSSEASSLYSYVSAPELECGGDEDSYGYSSPRSYRLTRKDSTTLPQDLVWQVIYGPARVRDDDDDMRSRRSSTGKRSAKSRRNSDGGASVHTARRSKSKSKITADATMEGARSHSRSRTLKPKHPRNSSTSMSSSVLHSVTSSTPSTVSGFTVVARPSVFPSPAEPMPAYAVQAVQAAQAIVGKGIANSDSNITTRSSNKSASQTEKNPSNPSQNKINDIPPRPDTHISSVVGKSYPNNSLTTSNSLQLDSNHRSSFMDYLDSPSGDRVTLGDVLVGYNRSNIQAHVYAKVDQRSDNGPPSLSKKDALPPVPRDPPPEGSLPLPPPKPSRTKPRDVFDQKKAFPPVLPRPISHDKSQSSSLHPGFPDRNHHERGRSTPGHTSQTSTSPSPSRPLPVTPMAAPIIPVAGPSKPVNKVEALSSGLSNSDKTRKTIHKSIRQVKGSDRSLSETLSDRPTDVILSSKQDNPVPQSRPPVEQKSEGVNNKQEDAEIKTASMSSDGTVLPTLTIASPSLATRHMTPESSTPSVQTSGISPSSSLPSFPGDATSVSSVDQSVQQPIDLVQQESNPTIVSFESASGPDSSTEAKMTENKERPVAQQIEGVCALPDRRSKLTDSPQGDGSGMMPGPTLETHLQTDVTKKDMQIIIAETAQDKKEILAEGNLNERDHLAQDAGLQKIHNVSHGMPPAEVSGNGRENEEENPEFYNTSDLTIKEDSPTGGRINTPISFSKQRVLDRLTDELGRSIHDSSMGSIGSHRLKDGYYSNHNASLSASSFPLADPKSSGRKYVAVDSCRTHEVAEDPHENQSIYSIPPSLRPEHFPLPPSSSSMELPQLDDQRITHDGRTSSPNVGRARPFSPDSMRSFSGRHEQNRSVGDVSQAASGISFDAVKVSSSPPNQRPSSRTSSAFMSINGTRINHSSTLPTVDGVSPAPGPFQRFSKTTLPIGNKPVVNNTGQITRQRSGSEPQYPSVLHYRPAGRLSTIQQSPIQTTRPAPLPLRKDRAAIGSMTFPETPYEYTPIPTPGAQRMPGPRPRGISFLSNQPRKASRLGSEFSPRRPAGPRPQRNFGSTKNASSKVASPPNTARSFDLEPVSDGGILPDFRPRPVEWRAYTLEAAKWTFTSEQLQEIVSQAIQQSSMGSSVRLLPLNVLDEIRPEIARLEILQQDITIRYCANVTRRRVILKSLRHNINNEDWAKRLQLTQELNDTSYLADQLTKDLFHTMHRLQTLHRLIDVHTSSALAIAARKLDTSFVKHLEDMTRLYQHLHQVEEEKEVAWATAERLEMEVMELRDKLEAMSVASPISDNSSRRNSRKRSVRASKASFRLSRSTRLSHSSTSSNYVFASPPPVPPIPRLAQAPNSRILSLNTDISSGAHSAQSAHSFAMSPTPESRALARAQKELYDMLGFSSGPRRSIHPRRPQSEILSPVTASEAHLSPRAPDHHSSVTSLLRRNNSIPISPYIISQNFRE